MKPTTTLSDEDVLDILELLKTDTQEDIADAYRVPKKTISRINTGETWSKLSQRIAAKEAPDYTVKVPRLPLHGLPQEFVDFLDDLIAVKNAYAFDFDSPLSWGRFDWHDGVHSVATDGIILWESEQLAFFAENIASSGYNDHPVFASQASELPTLALQEIMTQPIGEKFTLLIDTGGTVRLEAERGVSVVLRQRYVALASKMKLEIRRAGARADYVYLTKAKTKTTADTSSVILAAVSTMTE